MNDTIYQSFDPPDDEWAKMVCAIGTDRCCRYLTMSPKGRSCEKNAKLRAILDARVERGAMRAVGDNCIGRGSR